MFSSTKRNVNARSDIYVKNGIHNLLTYSAAANDIQTVREVLLDSTVDVNWQGIYGNTALHWAVANTNAKMALFICDRAKNINFNVQDHNGKTALHLAVGKGWYHFNDNSYQSELPQAPVIQKLIKNTSLDIQDENGNTALHIAIMRRDYNTVSELLKNGASLRIANKSSQLAADMLNMSYLQVSLFINRYVSIFTLSKKIWENNKAAILELLPPLEEKLEEKPMATHDTITPGSDLNGPSDVIFEQAIYYMEDMLSEKNKALISPIVTHCDQFRDQLVKLKQATIDCQLSPEAAEAIAQQSLRLTQKITSLTVTNDDIAHFHKITSRHIPNSNSKKYALIGKIIGAIVGAAIGVLVGVMLGMLAGPVAAFTGLYAGHQGAIIGAIIGASIGASLGAGIGFWGARKYLAIQQSFNTNELESAANKIAQPFGKTLC